LGGAGFDGFFTLQVYDFDAESGRCEHKLFEQTWQKVPTEQTGWDLPWADQVVFSADSSRLVCPDAKGSLLELDARTGTHTKQWKEHERMVTSMDVAHERGVLASGSRDGRIVLWRVAGI
jgi:WD40 repeat protein